MPLCYTNGSLIILLHNIDFLLVIIMVVNVFHHLFLAFPDTAPMLYNPTPLAATKLQLRVTILNHVVDVCVICF